jgi:hypothetical protein
VAKGDFSGQFAEAFQVEGFSLVEVLEICPSYGLKYNKEVSLKDIEKKFDIPLVKHKRTDAKPIEAAPRQNPPSLIDSLQPVAKAFDHQLSGEFPVILGGSAGEGVQLAADVLSRAAIACGLNVTKKGSYPVTVGVGFSAVELIFSPRPIQFTGSRDIKWAVISSQDGLNYFSKRIEGMKSGNVLMDGELEAPATEACVMQGGFREAAGARDSILLAALVMLHHSPIFPPGAFVQTLANTRVGQKIDIEALQNQAAEIAAEIKKKYPGNQA